MLFKKKEEKKSAKSNQGVSFGIQQDCCNEGQVCLVSGCGIIIKSGCLESLAERNVTETKN